METAVTQAAPPPRRSRRTLLLLVLAAALLLAPPLVGVEIPLGRFTLAAFSDGRSPQRAGYSHWIDPMGEGWALRIGALHWVLGLTR